MEIQKTFYQPPQPETVERWRAKAPACFLFTLKAWQLITHQASSPTYRHLQASLSERELDPAGGSCWHKITRIAWQRTQTIADAAGANAVVFQTPKRFTPSREKLGQLTRFFEGIDRRHRRMVFEPRGKRGPLRCSDRYSPTSILSTAWTPF